MRLGIASEMGDTGSAITFENCLNTLNKVRSAQLRVISAHLTLGLELMLKQTAEGPPTVPSTTRTGTGQLPPARVIFISSWVLFWALETGNSPILEKCFPALLLSAVLPLEDRVGTWSHAKNVQRALQSLAADETSCWSSCGCWLLNILFFFLITF